MSCDNALLPRVPRTIGLEVIQDVCAQMWPRLVCFILDIEDTIVNMYKVSFDKKIIKLLETYIDHF